MSFVLNLHTTPNNTCDDCRKRGSSSDNLMIELYASNRYRDRHIILIHQKCLARCLARAQKQHDAHANPVVSNG